MTTLVKSIAKFRTVPVPAISAVMSANAVSAAADAATAAFAAISAEGDAVIAAGFGQAAVPNPLVEIAGVLFVHVFTDRNGKFLLGIARDGAIYKDSTGALQELRAAEVDVTRDYDAGTEAAIPAEVERRRMLFVRLGQSLASAQAGPAITTAVAAAGKVSKLSAGYLPAGAASTGFVDGVEVTYETGMAAFLNRLYTKINAASGYAPLLAGVIAANGGVSMTTLVPGGTHYEQMLTYVAEAHRFAQEAGEGLFVPRVHLVHGNSDSTAKSRFWYAARLARLADCLNRDIPRITGQVEPVILDVDPWDNQGTSAGEEDGVLIAQIAAEDLHPLIRVCPPCYDVPRSDLIHPTNAGYAYKYGRHAEWVFGQEFVGREQAFTLTRENARWVSDTVVEFMVFPPTTPLVLDTSGTYVDVANAAISAGRGIEFWDGGSPGARTASVSIASVTVHNSAMAEGPAALIRVTLSGAPTGPDPTFHYATRTLAGSGTEAGARGGFRDSNAAVAAHDSRALHRWMGPAVVRLPRG